MNVQIHGTYEGWFYSDLNQWTRHEHVPIWASEPDMSMFRDQVFDWRVLVNNLLDTPGWRQYKIIPEHEQHMLQELNQSILPQVDCCCGVCDQCKGEQPPWHSWLEAVQEHSRTWTTYVPGTEPVKPSWGRLLPWSLRSMQRRTTC